jgi:hypothetical protein
MYGSFIDRDARSVQIVKTTLPADHARRIEVLGPVHHEKAAMNAPQDMYAVKAIEATIEGSCTLCITVSMHAWKVDLSLT